MKTLTLTSLFILFSLHSIAQVGETFPDLDGETVEGDRIHLPDDVAGKYTLVGMAYSKKSEGDLDTWVRPIYMAFMREKENAGLFSDFAFDINVYIVPMFTGVKAAGKKPAMKKALDKIEPAMWPHMLFYGGALKPYKEALDFEAKDVPYLFLLDPQGKIIYATSGAFSESKMDTIKSKIQ